MNGVIPIKYLDNLTVRVSWIPAAAKKRDKPRTDTP